MYNTFLCRLLNLIICSNWAFQVVIQFLLLLFETIIITITRAVKRLTLFTLLYSYSQVTLFLRKFDFSIFFAFLSHVKVF